MRVRFVSFSFSPLARVKVSWRRDAKAYRNSSLSNEVRTMPTAKKISMAIAGSVEIAGPSYEHNGLDVATRCPVNSRIALMEAESNLMGRSARASDSSARRPRHQPPYNLLVSSPCFRGHVFITLSFPPSDAIIHPCVLLPSITRLAILFQLLYRCLGGRQFGRPSVSPSGFSETIASDLPILL